MSNVCVGCRNVVVCMLVFLVLWFVIGGIGFRYCMVNFVCVKVVVVVRFVMFLFEIMMLKCCVFMGIFFCLIFRFVVWGGKGVICCCVCSLCWI